MFTNSVMRRALGQRANAVKTQVEQAFERRLADLARSARDAELRGPSIDISLPGRGTPAGRLHPITRVAHELLDVFTSLGFDVAAGPEVDLHEFNFDKLGFPPDHPATGMQDSFFVDWPPGTREDVLLRTLRHRFRFARCSRGHCRLPSLPRRGLSATTPPPRASRSRVCGRRETGSRGCHHASRMHVRPGIRCGFDELFRSSNRVKRTRLHALPPGGDAARRVPCANWL